MNNTQKLGLLGTAGLGAGLGAGLMYLLDPQGGSRRRALARDQAVHALKKGGVAARKTSRDLANRTRGLVAETGSRLKRREVDDQTLADRVRAKLGRAVSHPSAIEVAAMDGRVILSGPVLASEVDRLLSNVRSVKGVKEVENRLEVHEQADNIPALQGSGQVVPRYQRNWAPSTRLLAGTAGGALAIAGLGKRGPLGAALGAVGLGLLARGLTNLEAKRLIGVGAGRRAVDLQKTIHILAPVDEVFRFWSRFENFPLFMANVLEVRDLGGGRSHWVVRGPAGSRLHWDAEITRFEPNRVLAWKTLPGAVVENAGIIHFESADGGTRLHIQLTYNPPAGAVGHTVASLLGSHPKKQIDEDLVRLKSLLEEGKATAKGETVYLSEVESAFQPVGT